MKQLLFLVLLITNSSVFTQLPEGSIQGSVGYAGHGLIWPGIKLGIDFPFREEAKVKELRNRVATNHFRIYQGPRLTLFGRKNFFTGLLISEEMGFQRQIRGGKYHLGGAVGIGYMTVFNVLSYSVDLQGEIVGRERERRGSFLPSLSCQAERQLGTDTRLYAKGTYGAAFSAETERKGHFFVELGVLITLKRTSSNRGE